MPAATELPSEAPVLATVHAARVDAGVGPRLVGDASQANAGQQCAESIHQAGGDETGDTVAELASVA
jgi:hypothetical protein